VPLSLSLSRSSLLHTNSPCSVPFPLLDTVFAPSLPPSLPSGARRYTSVLNCVTTILSEEGPAGFYKGVLPNVIKIVPNNAIRFLAYETLLPIFGAQKKQK